MSDHCPRGIHPYPQARMTKKNYGRPRFYCGACRRDRDNDRHARGGGWGEPDMEAVKRAVYGDPPEYLNQIERRLAAEQIAAVPLPGRLSIRESARHLRCSTRHVSYLFKKIKEEEMARAITVRLTLRNILTELKPGDRFADDPEFGTVKSVRLHANSTDAVVYTTKGSRDSLGLPQTVRLIRGN